MTEQIHTLSCSKSVSVECLVTRQLLFRKGTGIGGYNFFDPLISLGRKFIWTRNP